MIGSDGNIIGINTYGSNLDQNLFYAVSVGEVIPMLNQHSVPYELENGTGLERIFSYIAIIVVIAIIAASALLLKRKPAPASVKNTETVRAPFIRSLAPQYDGLVIKLHNQPIQIGRDSAVCRLAYLDNTPGISSNHCKISFNKADGQFTVIDFNSSYGTFITSGQRIAAGIPQNLAPGASIYLGPV